jgi:serine/threonine protein kinase/tetratricopeptide (TPR) repeat protein
MSTEDDRAPLSTEVSPQRDPSDGLVQVQAAAAEERLTIGEKLSGRYRIERELGEGGMGMVHLVTDEQVVGETFAVKVLKDGLDPQALELLRDEVRKTRKLSHPNIVDVHSVNVDGKKLYVLMEYLEGKSLNALLDEEFGRGMVFSHAWPIIEDVGAALGYAHDHNVIHSDLKPANIFLTTSGKTKLLDFGIARVSRGPLLHQRSGPLALTPAYASCEMLQGKEADPRDDIYSFACVIYEMLCGKRPFGELTALEAREAGARVPPIGVLTREQNAALAQALAFDRKGRTTSVEELLVGLADKKPRARPIALLTGAIITAMAALVVIFWALDQLWISRHSIVVQSVAAEAQPAAARTAATPNGAAFNPPPHSIAVLPFVNMSGDASQQYFSDGLTEELLNSLSRINELQVAARTSSFSFQGEHPDIATVAHKLNVVSVLEGSVRRSGHTIRVTAQLNNGVTGFTLWSQTYDRDLGDVLKLQTEIATAVATALELTLLGDVGRKIELGRTRNPAAFDAYLRALRAYEFAHDAKGDETAIAAFSEAIRLDPNYALAFAGRSLAWQDHADLTYGAYAKGATIGEDGEKALADARQAVTLAPELAEGHLALHLLFQWALDFANARAELERSVALAPGSADVLARYGRFAVLMGRTDVGIAAARRAVTLDPLNHLSHYRLGQSLLRARRYAEAVAAFSDVLVLDPQDPDSPGLRGLAYYGLGDFQHARASCEARLDDAASRWCLALTYQRLARHADAEAALAKLRAASGDRWAYRRATIYAQWGNTSQALESLESAWRLRLPELRLLKADPLLDPLRKEPRFQAIERALRFPD